jgi:predicted dehydrogenase
MQAQTSRPPLRVGLVGAGPWASLVHGPMLAAGPETELAGVWARRLDAATELAARHGVEAFEQLEQLFAVVDAVAFAVPPAVQADLAARAAAAGKALLLEKPIADDLASAERLVAEIDRAGVPSLVVLTWRYAEPVRKFLAATAQETLDGGTGAFLSNGLLVGPFRTPWRLERGPLLDLGPHVIDLLAAALGPVTAVHARGELRRWVNLVLEHQSGATSQAALSASVAVNPYRAYVEVFGETANLSVDCTTVTTGETFATLRAELAATVSSGRPHPLDAHHGLELQRLLAAAEASLAGARRVE